MKIKSVVRIKLSGLSIKGLRIKFKPYRLILTNYHLPLITVLILTTYHLSLTTAVYASFETIPGVKNISIGESGVASISDVSAVFVNPAGLAYLKGKECTFEYQKPFLGLTQPENNVEGYYKPDISNGAIAVGFPLPKNIGGAAFYYTGLAAKGLYAENRYAFCYARTLEEIFLREKEEEFSFGFALKYLTLEYKSDEYTDDFFEKYGNSSSGFSGDFGLRYSPFRGLDFGISVPNIFSSDMGLLYRNKPEKQLLFGSAYQLNEWALVSAAYSYKNSYPQNNFHAGLEMNLIKDLFVMRLGGNRNEISSGFGFNFSKEPKYFTIDYGFVMPLYLKDTSGTHTIAISFELPPVVKSLEEEKVEALPITEPVEERPVSPETKPIEIMPVTEPKPVPEKKKIDVEEIMRQHYNKAIWHLQRGEDEQAIKEFEAILRYDPKHKPSIIRITAAKKRLEVKRKKENMRLHWQNGIKFFQMKKFVEAKREFEEVLKYDPAHKPSLHRLELIKKVLKEK